MQNGTARVTYLVFLCTVAVVCLSVHFHRDTPTVAPDWDGSGRIFVGRKAAGFIGAHARIYRGRFSVLPLHRPSCIERSFFLPFSIVTSSMMIEVSSTIPLELFHLHVVGYLQR